MEEDLEKSANQTSSRWATHRLETLTDEMDLDVFGHLHNLAYLRMFERARWQMITDRGYGFEQVRERQVGPVVLGIDVQYRKESGAREKVFIESRVVSFDRKVGSIVQTMKNESGEVLCEAKLVVGLFDLKARKLISPTPEWRQACGEVETKTEASA